MSPASSSDLPLRPDLPDFAALSEKLQEVAHALQHAGYAAACKDDLDPDKKPAVYRTYKVSGFMVEEEQKMLERFKAATWQEMFDKVYDHLYTLALLMRNFDAGETLDGFSVQLMGTTLMAPLDMFSRLCSLVAAYRLVEEAQDQEQGPSHPVAV